MIRFLLMFMSVLYLNCEMLHAQILIKYPKSENYKIPKNEIYGSIKETTFEKRDHEDIVLKNYLDSNLNELNNTISKLYESEIKKGTTTEKIGDIFFSNNKTKSYSKYEYDEAILLKEKCGKQFENYLKKLKTNKESLEKPNCEIELFNSSKELTVVSIDFNISEGSIKDIRVKVIDSKGVIHSFENKASISLVNYDQEVNEKFIYNVKDLNRFIKLGDILAYEPLPGKYSIPNDENRIIFNSVLDLKKELYANIDLNSNLDVRIYSDLLSLFGREGNGLIQTEIKGRILVSTKSKLGELYIFNYIEPKIRYSKFDSKFESVEVNANSNSKLWLLSREQLMLNQSSFLNLDLKFNLIKAKILNHSTEYNWGFTYDFTEVKHKGTSNVSTVNMRGMYFEGKIRIAKSKYFGFEGSFQILFQTIASTNLDVFHQSDEYFIPTFSMYYLPKANRNNSLFIRFKSFSSLGISKSYPLLQFGLVSKLSVNRKK